MLNITGKRICIYFNGRLTKLTRIKFVKNCNAAMNAAIGPNAGTFRRHGSRMEHDQPRFHEGA